MLQARFNEKTHRLNVMKIDINTQTFHFFGIDKKLLYVQKYFLMGINGIYPEEGNGTCAEHRKVVLYVQEVVTIHFI